MGLGPQFGISRGAAPNIGLGFSQNGSLPIDEKNKKTNQSEEFLPFGACGIAHGTNE